MIIKKIKLIHVVLNLVSHNFLPLELLARTKASQKPLKELLTFVELLGSPTSSGSAEATVSMQFSRIRFR